MTAGSYDISSIVDVAAAEPPKVVKGVPARDTARPAPAAGPTRKGARGSGGKGTRTPARDTARPDLQAEGPVPLRRIQVCVRDDLHRRLKLIAAETDTTMSDLIRAQLRRPTARSSSELVRSRPADGYTAIQVLVPAAEHRRLKILAIEQGGDLVGLLADAIGHVLGE